MVRDFLRDFRAAGAVQPRYRDYGHREFPLVLLVRTSALLVTGTAQHYRLWVANMKGRGFGPGYTAALGYFPDRSVPHRIRMF